MTIEIVLEETAPQTAPVLTPFEAMFQEAGLPELMGQFSDGTSMVYWQDEEQTEVVGILGPVARMGKVDEDGEYIESSRQVTISRDPDGTYGGLAEPELDGAFEIGEERWSVEDIVMQTGAVTVLRIVRQTAATQGKRVRR